MAVADSLSGVSDELDKIIRQLAQIEDSVGTITSGASNLPKVFSGVGTANGVASTTASFGTSTTASSSGETTSNGTPVPSFLGRAAATAATVGVAAAKFAWNVAPSVEDAYTNQNLLFQAGFMSTGKVDNNYTKGRIRAAFGDTVTGPFDQQAAAALLGSRGIGINSQSFGQTAGESGFMSRLTGMSNLQTAAGASAMQFGGANVTGKLMNFGIMTNDLSTGKYGGMGKVIDQLWSRWYGSANAKVPEEVFEADLMGGFLGRDLQYFFGEQPELYQMVVAGLRLKAKSGGVAGIDFNENAKGPRSAKAMARKVGMNEFQNPTEGKMRIETSQLDALNAATEPLVKGFLRGADTLVAINEKLEEVANSEWGKWLLEQKAFFETITSSTQGLAVLNGALALIGSLVGSVLGRLGISALFGGGKPTNTSGVKTGPAPPGGPTKPGVKPATGGGFRGGIIGTLTSLAGGFAADWLRENTTIFEKGSAPDNIAYALAMAGAGGVGGALAGGPAAPITATIGALIGLGLGIYNNLNDQYASGGTSTSDSINARLSKGEYVINARAAQEIGKSHLDALNSLGHAFGSAYASPARQFDKGGSTGDAISGADVVAYATQPEFLTTPYIDHTTLKNWGPGTGWDCSSFTSYVFKKFGLDLPAYSDDQYKMGTPVEREDLRPGDLVFFHTNKDKVTGHVGIYVGNGKMVNAANPDSDTRIQSMTWDTYVGARRLTKGDQGTGGVGATGDNVNSGGSDGSASGSYPSEDTISLGALRLMMMPKSQTLSSPMSTYMQVMANPHTMQGGADIYQQVNPETGKPKSRTASKTQDKESSRSSTSVKSGKGGKWLADFLYKKGLRGDDLRRMWSIAMRETGGTGDPNSVNRRNRNGSVDYGLFQINDLLGQGDGAGKRADMSIMRKNDWSMEDLFDPNKNFAVMMHMSKYGQDLSAWGVHNPDGSLTGWAKHLGEAKVKQFEKALYSYWDQFDAAANKAGIPSDAYAHGTDYVARSGKAEVHQGEIIIPASQSTDFREALREALSGSGREMNLTFHVNIEKASDEEADRFVKKVIQKMQDENKHGRLRGR